ncbi:DNA methyltransferase [Agromyces sp. H66]|uniref:DNA methyltransferase n=1 Tax=Agromyces sp. H66 TaxID=2529859 RepID=UPI0010A995E7|nr:DNA methyltransferase [Agromyces sp. H66]
MADNKLFYGDNLEVLAKLPTDSVDLVYLDPPFNSARNYNVIFARGTDAHHDVGAQIEAFTDTWTWTQATEEEFAAYVSGGLPVTVGDALTAFRTLLGENDALAYLVNMAPRLVQLRRVLKPTGSLWLHCDPVMSHYLKVLLDAIFDPRSFRNEVIWKRTSSKSHSTTRLASNHDVILVYAASEKAVWNERASFIAYDADALDAKTLSKYSHRDPDGRLYRLDNLVNPNRDRPNLTYEFLGVTRVWRWTKERMQAAYEAGIVVQTAPGRVPQMKRYLDEMRGRPMSDVWEDIAPLNSQAAERLGYPTQKPLALLERILKLASNEGDVVLDPFAGCGTTIDAAQNLKRRWIGIDITYIAVDLIEKRLLHAHGPSIKASYDVSGIPRDSGGAQALFDRNPFDFERWAVSQINAQPNEKQVGDRGIDGVARFPLGTANEFGRVLVSVKGGKQLNPAMVRDLRGTIERQKAELGVLITQTEPTRGMLEEVHHSGSYTHPATGQTYPRLQIITTDQLLAGKRPQIPPTVLPYIAASKAAAPDTSVRMF